MAEKINEIRSRAAEETSGRTNMMDLWRESIQKAHTERQTVRQAEKDEKADLERRIKGGQAECPTCSSRQYKDGSDDSGVSFQAARHINAATAGTVIMAHEGEHVSAEDSNAKAEGGQATSTVALEYAKCPECGRTYVKGGVTTTTVTRPAAAKQKNPAEQSDFDIKV